ncbi:MAG: 3-phosphoglycerate dehydrogenase family protein [Anaerovoracaceae bacterium]
MYRIATLNKISPVGLNHLKDNFEIIENPDDAHGIVLRSFDMHEMLDTPNLLAVARAGAGVNNIPIKDYTEKGIVVFNTPGANANAVKELVIGGMLLVARNLPNALDWTETLTEDISKTVEKGKGQFAGSEIAGKTLGVIGLGAIGVMVANAALALGMRVIGYDPYISLDSAHALSNKIPVAPDLSTMLPACDYITLHVPVIEQTINMIDDSRFEQMKDGVVLLNFARDKLVEDEAFLKALDSGKIRKYVTDFPNQLVNNRKNVIAIPHLGASTLEAENNCAFMAVDEIMDYLENGNIKNSVNYPECNMGLLNPDAAARVCILNRNIPKMLGKITGIMADLQINIRDMTNKSRGDFAYTVLDIDTAIELCDLKKSLDVEGIIKVRILR